MRASNVLALTSLGKGRAFFFSGFMGRVNDLPAVVSSSASPDLKNSVAPNWSNLHLELSSCPVISIDQSVAMISRRR